MEGRGEFEGCSPRTRAAAQCSPCLIAGKEVIGRRLVVERGEEWTQGAIIPFNASSSESKCHKVQLPPSSSRILCPVHLTSSILRERKLRGPVEAGAVCCARRACRGMADSRCLEVLLADGAVAGYRGEPDVLLRAHAAARSGG